MNIQKYNSLNEKLKLCYAILKDELTAEELAEINEEIREYKEELNDLLFDL